MNGSRQTDRASKELRRTANKLILKLENDVEVYKGRCLFVVDDSGRYCDKPVGNKCHIVSESGVLDRLKDNEKVLELQWGVSQYRELFFSVERERQVQEPTTFEPSKRPTGDVCIGWFACKRCDHDDEFQPDHDAEFQPTDVADPDFCAPEIRFLAGYRIALFVADQLRLAIELYRLWDQIVKKEVANKPRERPLWLGENEKLKKGIRKAEKTVKLLGKHWHARKTGGTFDLDVVSAQVLTFRSKLRLAGGVSYGKATAITVFPVQEDLHKMGIFYLRRDSDLAGEDIERLGKVARNSEESDNYGVTVTNELMTNGWGSLAVSPKSYEGLNNEDRETIQNLMAEHARGLGLVKSIVRQSSESKRRRK